MPKALSPSLAIAVSTALICLVGCKPKDAASQQDPLQVERLVEVAAVGSTAASDGTYTGLVGARVQSDLGFRIPGKVIQRLVDTGQVVKEGQPLMRMDPTDYAHALVAQVGNVAAARARWIQAAADEKRNRGLVATGAVSQSAYDQVKAAADSAKALLDAAQAQEQVARNQEAYSVLVADADGTVMETLAEPGQVVSAGQMVVRLAHAGPREAIVNLPETVRPVIGSTARASLYGDSVQTPAHLRQLSDAADPRTRTFEARYVMDGVGAAAPLGATVTIGIVRDRATNPLSVPLGAIDDEGGGPGVWIIDAKTSEVSYRPVKVHSLGAEAAEISGDLRAGETVVATGGHFLHQGEHVRVAAFRAAMQ
jgi:RND family efflux transporter MFP subunit